MTNRNIKTGALQGTVKFYNEGKNFGFIIPEGGGPDVYMNNYSLRDTVKEGDVVNYDTKPGKENKPDIATNVTLA